MGSLVEEKSAALLRFLKDTATLRRKRISAYGADDKLLWFYDIPRDSAECRSAFFDGNHAELADLWLEVRKKRMPTQPPVPEIVKDWVRLKDLEQADREPELLQEITVIIERKVPVPDSPPDQGRVVMEKVSEVRHLQDHPEVENAWLEYLANQWEPWAREMLSWQEVQLAYEGVDFMRRRLEEAEERYELILAVGLLQWRDSTISTVKRHLLTAPAEISLDAARGILTVGPSASFEKFRIELDMLELRDRPRLEENDFDDRLEELDVQAYDRTKVGEILRIIANRASPDAQVDENGWKPLERADEKFRVIYAPALILRERRPTAYEELINCFLKAAESESPLQTTAPWDRFIREGEPSSDFSDRRPDDDFKFGDAGSRLYFPLPTNEEQQRIAERLKARPYILVKGPPGTGKSHTIANLICHLLASGERILVTAHAPKALTVLRDMLPRNIRGLCVTAFGSTRQDHQLLEESVRGILSQKSDWKGEIWAQANIDQLKEELQQLEGRRAQVDRGLHYCREAETHSHTLPGGYQGTAAQIARRVEHQKEMYGWFPELHDDQNRCPLQHEDIAFLAQFHCTLTEKRLNELRLDIGNFSLPDADSFGQAIEGLNVAEHVAEVARSGLPKEQMDALQQFSDGTLETCRAFLSRLEEHATRARRVLGDLADEIIKDLLIEQEVQWNRLALEVNNLVDKIRVACMRVGTTQIELPPDIENVKLLADARRRLDHFMRGGRRGLAFLTPRVVRETRYVEQRCLVDTRAPVERKSLETLLVFLELKALLEQFSRVWPTPITINHLDPMRTAHDVSDLAQELSCLLELFRSRAPGALNIFPIGKRMTLAELDERARCRRPIEAEIASRHARQAREFLEMWLRLIHSLPHGSTHPCMAELGQAIEERDPTKWRAAWDARENLRAEKDHFRRYQELLDNLQKACSDLAIVLKSTRGSLECKEQLLQLDKAWMWSAAKVWLKCVSDSDTYRRLREERHLLQYRVEKKVEELTSRLAWQSFFSRFDEQTEQNLTAWTKAVARIGKGTGKYAYRHRRTARKYLMACIPKIPAWIMPLHKLWETTESKSGVFDTVIIDEASQAGIESLAILLLAKRVIVVGDDKQNSPESVGILENDILRLSRDHLSEFLFQEEFRPDTSLFDHAERAFGNLISLREHFRCVPEIIRFSNEMCYNDAPLIPLRQPPPDRLPPFRAIFTSKGYCEGDKQRIVNRAEAEEVVQTIQKCVEDEAYEGKTMGVIVLQGHAQAELIERKLAEVLEPKDREERKLRCGVPANFQGDQRDVIFLSLVVAPNHPYRALTNLQEQRRFNVAMSRARDQVWLFHSVQQHDLSREDLRWRLLNFLYSADAGVLEGLYEESDRLEREAKRLYREPGNQPEPYESWFELDVALELLRRKYHVRPQYNVAGYRIDLVVEGTENRLAVECDGDAWHGPDKYDQDMTRQRQLERASWTFVRIRESEFYANRGRAVEQVVEECHRLGIQPVTHYDAGPLQESARETNATLVGTMISDDDVPGQRPAADVESAALLENDSARESGPFTGYSSECGFPDPREASPTNVRATLGQIIEKDGPLTRESVFRLYVEGCADLHRVGKIVRQALNRALGAMLRSGEIVQEDELGDGSPEGLVVRLADTPKVRERSTGRRDLLEIPPSELFLALDRICASFTGIMQDDKTLARALLDHYAFTRLTEVRRKHLTRILSVHHRQRQ